MRGDASQGGRRTCGVDIIEARVGLRAVGVKDAGSEWKKQQTEIITISRAGCATGRKVDCLQNEGVQLGEEQTGTRHEDMPKKGGNRNADVPMPNSLDQHASALRGPSYHINWLARA